MSGLPFPPSGNLSNPGIKPRSPALQADSLPSKLPGKQGHDLNPDTVEKLDSGNKQKKAG